MGGEREDRVCLLPRLALSDLMVINGLVRTLCARSDDVIVVAKRDHVASIRSLFGDVERLRFRFVASWSALHGPDGVLSAVEKAGYRVVPLPSFRAACPYALLGLDPSLARTAFAMRRSQDREAALLRCVREAVGETYVVVHDDDERRIRSRAVPRGYPVVRVRDPRFRTPSIFDWIGALDHAMQLHAVDSCFLVLADYLSLRPRKFLHAYADTCGIASAKYAPDVVTIYST